MEIQQNPPAIIAKKLWKMVRIVLYLLKKGISKSKLLFNLHILLLKRGNKIASKAISQAILHLHQDYYSTGVVSCRSSTDIRLSIVSRPPPREYEFSCSNSPNFPSYFSKRKNQHYNYRSSSSEIDQINVVHKVFDILNSYENNNLFEGNYSPAIGLPGFGHSPMVRQLRVTDSPFSVKENNEEINPHEVDKDAEEFIKKFRKQLKQQARVAALESSSSPYQKYWSR